MIRIFLTGYMGAGKTTLGKAFARELNIPFIDLDWYIEERLHKSIRELFTERGEASFRELERTMKWLSLKTSLSRPEVVLLASSITWSI